MAQRKTYGNTWWGRQFLNTLQEIDFSNRLPRGKSYANKGAVVEIDVTQLPLTAQVQGTRPRPYKQTIQLRTFKPKERTAILNCIVENPFLLSQLLNRRLPPQLDERLQERGIQVFPDQWDDLEAQCSCPDWALPCKHLAAVIYLLANEIDQNPFRIFEWRGLNLLATLEVMGIVPKAVDRQQISRLADTLLPAPDGTTATITRQEGDSFWLGLHFSTIEPSYESLAMLLPPIPAFYPNGDYKSIFLRHLKRLRKQANEVEWDRFTEAEIPPFLDEVTLLLDAQAQVIDLILVGPEEETSLAELSEDTLMVEWLHYLAEIPLYTLARHSRDIQVWRMVYQFAQVLLERSACLPMVMEVGEGYRLRWKAILQVPGVSEIMDTLLPEIGPEMVLIEYGEDQPAHYLSAAAQLGWMLSLSLETLIQRLVQADPEDRIDQWFWEDPMWNSEEIGWREAPFAVHQWLSRFSLAQRRYQPVLQVLERDWDFALRLMVSDLEEPQLPPVPLSAWMEEVSLQSALVLTLLQDLAMLGEYVPRLAEALGEQLDSEIDLDSAELLELLEETAPGLKWLGIEMLLPKSLEKLLRPSLSLLMEENRDSSLEQTYLSLEEMLRFKWQVAIGDQQMDPATFQQAIRGMAGLIKLRDQYVVIDPKELERIFKRIDHQPQLGAFEILQASLAEEFEGAPVRMSPPARKKIEDLLSLEAVPPPEQLEAQLRPYQQRGFEWLYKNRKIGLGSLLADDMGLGKTLQVISLLQKLQEEGQLKEEKGLVVAPTSLLTNWGKEIEKFAPSLSYHIYHGAQRHLESKADVIITSYGVARSDQKKLSKTPWALLVIDEAQQIKNPKAKSSQAIKKIPAQQRIAMSGTPVENRLSEYWSLFDFANRGYLSPLPDFKRNYIQPIEKERDPQVIRRFKTITSPFIMRRLKTDKTIISDLPEKIVQDQTCHLSTAQTALYQSVVDQNLRVIEEEEGIHRLGLLFKLMTALKQICNHPAQYLKKGNALPTDSGKIELLFSLLDNIRESGEKVLIFTQYTQMGAILQGFLEERYEEEVPFLYGGLSRKKRDEMVQEFQTKPYRQIMLLSLKAAGTGLNLTAANHVIHYDLWWNPAVENQATDRAFRIGQDKNVWVHRLITAHTFEEKINEMIQQKAELADLTVSTGENWIGELSNREITRLFQYG